MKRRVLVVHPDPTMAGEVVNLLSEFGEQHQVDFGFHLAYSVAAAQARSQSGPWDLLVTALELAPDADTPMAPGETRSLGLTLAARLREAMPGLRVLVISGEDAAVSPDAAVEGAEWAHEGRDLGRQLTLAADRLLGTAAPRQMELSIVLSTSKGCGYQLQLEGSAPGAWSPLTMDSGKLKDLVEQSRDVHIGTPGWEGELRRLGEALADELFQPTPANLQFRDAFNFWAGRVHRENIKVRFTVEDDLHPIAVEALKRRSDEDFWMLRNAIYRSQARSPEEGLGESRGLFQDEQTRHGPIRVLIIQADLPAGATVRIGGHDLLLQPLPSSGDEVTALATLLEERRRAGQAIGDVKVLRPADVAAPGTFRQLLERTLKAGPWHVVHYAGHTHYDQDAKPPVGYLLLPGSGALNPVDPLPVALFAWQLRNSDARFVFLSSCESAGQDFIYHLARENVPAIMGFLWKVNDERAVAFARSFYENLLDGERRTLENACFEAKKEMHARFRDDPIWASPVLVMQVGP